MRILFGIVKLILYLSGMKKLSDFLPATFKQDVLFIVLLTLGLSIGAEPIPDPEPDKALVYTFSDEFINNDGTLKKKDFEKFGSYEIK